MSDCFAIGMGWLLRVISCYDLEEASSHDDNSKIPSIKYESTWVYKEEGHGDKCLGICVVLCRWLDHLKKSGIRTVCETRCWLNHKMFACHRVHLQRNLRTQLTSSRLHASMVIIS